MGSTDKMELKSSIDQKQFLEKINENNQINDLDGYIITNDIAINKTTISSGLIKSKIVIRNSIVKGKFEIDGILFSNGIDFINTIFLGPVTVINCHAGMCDPDKTPSFSFKDQCKFNEIKIDNNCFSNFWLQDSYVAKFISINRVKFQKKADFSNTYFEQQIHVTNCNFSQDAIFNGAKFDHVVYFSKTFFHERTSFEKCKPKNDVIFENVIFHNDVSFDKSKFQQRLEFNKTIFKENISLQNTEIKNNEDKAIAYRKAKTAAQKHGLYDSADDYYYKEMAAIREQKKWWPRNIERVLFEKALGYGVKLENIFLSWLLVVLFFTTLFFIPHAFSQNNINFLTDTQASFLRLSTYFVDVNGWIPYFSHCLTLSVMKATIPAINPFQINENYIIPTYIEALIGTYLWAGVIASIGKKFLKN